MKNELDPELILRKKIIELEQLLEEKINYYENILSLLPGHVYWVNRDNIYLGCNNEQAKDAGLSSRQEIVNKRNSELPWRDQAAELDRINNQIMETGVAQSIIEYAEMIDGVKTYLSQKVPLKNRSGTIIGLLGISLDITELKKTQKELAKAKEKAEAANRAKSTFIANMSHDIRTPLSGIIGMTALLEEEITDPIAKENVRLVHESGKQLLSLLNSILEIAASNAAQEKKLRNSSFNLLTMLEKLVALEKPALLYKKSHLRLNLAADLPQWIEADQQKLYRILLNLLSNAIKFTDNGIVTVSARPIAQKRGKTILEFKIEDTGIGISAENQARIFDAFYRATPAYQGTYEGYGVGLHIVRQYLKSFKGTINVQSVENQGTSITITLPVKAIDPPNATALIEDCPEVSHINTLPKQRNVLLVEDNPMAMKISTLMLERLNLTVTPAINSTEALDCIKQKRFDWIITDIGLPDFSGFELARRIQAYEIEQQLPHTPMLDLLENSLSLNDLNRRFCSTLPEPAPEVNKNRSTKNNLKPLFDEQLAMKHLGSLIMLQESIHFLVEAELHTNFFKIQESYEQQHWEELHRLIHLFKNSCIYCGVPRLLEITTRFEKISLSQDEKIIKEVFEEFLTTCKETEQYLTAWLATKK